jgi:hypothetical protein
MIKPTFALALFTSPARRPQQKTAANVHHSLAKLPFGLTKPLFNGLDHMRHYVLRAAEPEHHEFRSGAR